MFAKQIIDMFFLADIFKWKVILNPLEENGKYRGTISIGKNTYTCTTLSENEEIADYDILVETYKRYFFYFFRFFYFKDLDYVKKYNQLCFKTHFVKLVNEVKRLDEKEMLLFLKLFNLTPAKFENVKSTLLQLDSELYQKFSDAFIFKEKQENEAYIEVLKEVSTSENLEEISENQEIINFKVGKIVSEARKTGDLLILNKYLEQDYDGKTFYLIGLKLEEVRLYKIAAIAYEKSVKKNYSPAILKMGYWYERGNIVTQDFNKAVELFTKIYSENKEAAFKLGMIYELEDFSEYNLELAKKYYKLAGDMGFTQGYHDLGIILFRENNINDANEYFEKCLKLGYINTYDTLGRLYEENQNYEKAFHYYQLGAKEELVKSIFSLGRFFETGSFVDSDIEKAREFYKRAEALGYKAGKNAIERLDRSEQIKFELQKYEIPELLVLGEESLANKEFLQSKKYFRESYERGSIEGLLGLLIVAKEEERNNRYQEYLTTLVATYKEKSKEFVKVLYGKKLDIIANDLLKKIVEIHSVEKEWLILTLIEININKKNFENAHQLIEKVTNSSNELLVLQGQLAYEENKFREALSIFEKVNKKDQRVNSMIEKCLEHLSE